MKKDLKRVYTKNHLTNVIFKVDFPKILELEKDKPSDFQKAIMASFPLLNEMKGKTVECNLTSEDIAVKDINNISWEFLSKDKKKKVLLCPTFLSLEYFSGAYTHFDDFLTDIKIIFESFNNFYPSLIAKRVGLRYINQINVQDGNPLDWDGYLNSDLYSVTKGFVGSSNVLRSMHMMEVIEDSTKLRFQFGEYNADYPNPIARKEFILDYDCFINDENEFSEIYDIAKRFNKIIKTWFEKSIDVKLRTEMGELNGE